MTDIADHARAAARADIDPVAQLRTAAGTSVVMTIGPALDATAAAMARAAIPAVAMERAPATRINAVVSGRETDRQAIDLAIDYLHRSPAITGQVLELG